MPINQECRLVLSDLYFYDFKSAYPRLLSSIDWDFKDVDMQNKEERNIAIGMAQRGNRNLYSFLSSSVEGLLQYYLTENEVADEEVIVSQKDGFILTRLLHNTEDFMNLDFRGIIDLLIISPDRKKYLAVMDDVVQVKGISNFYPALLKIYSKFKNLNLYNKSSLFLQLERIKADVLTCTDKSVFMVEIGDNYVIQLVNGSQSQVTSEEAFSVHDVNTRKYFDHYFKEFLQSLFIEYY